MRWEYVVEHKRALVFAFLIGCMACSFWIRVIPADSFMYSGYLGGREPDIWYNLRQIEVMAHHFPQYNWFDPMTAFPTGKSVAWGPLFPFVCALLVMVSGATTRPDLLVVSSYIGPIIGVVLIPVVFLLGRYIWDTLAGLAAALFVTIGPFTLFFRTSYGYVDHHCLEVLLSTAFILLYLHACFSAKSRLSAGVSFRTLFRPLMVAVLAGLVFFLGLLNMPTMLLFAFIVAIFTFAAYLYHSATGSSPDYLLLVNTVTFLVVIATYPFIGAEVHGMALSDYSWGQVICYILLVAGTLLLWYLGGLAKKSRTYLLGVLVAGAALGVLAFLISPGIFHQALAMFFGQQPDITTIQEMEGLRFSSIIVSWNFGIILAAIGALVVIWKLRSSGDYRIIFLVTWTAIIALVAVQHRRFEYYAAINFVLLSGIALSFAVSWAGRDSFSLIGAGLGGYFRDHGRTGVKKEKKTKIRTGMQPKPDAQNRAATSRGGRATAPLLTGMAKLLALAFVLIVTLLFLNTSAVNDFAYAKDPGQYMIDPNWVETLLWMREHTPLTGVDYFGAYSKETFAYPGEAYGVMAWWDYGHYITFIAGRIPNTNPFQDNLAGPRGAAAFYAAQDERTAQRILRQAGTLFVVTDTVSAYPRFHAIADWNNSTAGIAPYRQWFSFPRADSANLFNTFAFNTPGYYRTMIARLHLYDGSGTEPTTAYYLEYRNLPSLAYPVVTAYEELPVAEGMEKAERYRAATIPGTGAVVLSSRALYPLEDLPALQHFRLVFESAGNSAQYFSGSADISLRNTSVVKVFEYVPGARIRGEGTIEVRVVTNTGREFTYRQKSVNGSFVLPYSTTGNKWDVRTIGKYRIVETGKLVAVSESDVKAGKRVRTGK